MRRFPVEPSKGNKYIMMMYVYGANMIMSELLKNSTGPEIKCAYKDILS